MSRLTDNILFVFTVLVASLQSTTSAGQSQFAAKKDHDCQFSLSSIGTEKEKRDTPIETFTMTC